MTDYDEDDHSVCQWESWTPAGASDHNTLRRTRTDDMFGPSSVLARPRWILTDLQESAPIESGALTLHTLYISFWNKVHGHSNSQLALSTLRGLMNTKCDGTAPRPRAAGEGEPELPWNRTRLLRSGRYYPASTWPAWVPPFCVTQSKSLTLLSYWQRSPVIQYRCQTAPSAPAWRKDASGWIWKYISFISFNWYL